MAESETILAREPDKLKKINDELEFVSDSGRWN
jgi:hypothetical protein